MERLGKKTLATHSVCMLIWRCLVKQRGHGVRASSIAYFKMMDKWKNKPLNFAMGQKNIARLID
jgi:hypothetical protein